MLMYQLLFVTENENENDSRGSQATQAIIQRRRRPKRRSTGVCNVGTEVNILFVLSVVAANLIKSILCLNMKIHLNYSFELAN